MKKIEAQDLVAYRPFCGAFPIEVDLVYANPGHRENAFGQIYHAEGEMAGHRDLVKVVLLAASRLRAEHGWTLVLKDCLRPIEAQALMVETQVVKANPHWLVEPRFLSSPGQGGHPRGMAVDLAARGAGGRDVDFGTAFDHFSDSTDRERNPAHREYPGLSEVVYANRLRLTEAMVTAARDFNLPMLPLPQEWWDFRFPSDYTKDFTPISDTELPQHLKVMIPAVKTSQMDSRIIEELSRFGI